MLKVRRFLTFVVTLNLEHYIRNFEIPLLHFEGVCMVLVIKKNCFPGKCKVWKLIETIFTIHANQ